MSWQGWSFVVLASTTSAACKHEAATSTAGDEGRVHFAYTAGRCDAGTCPFDKPLMVGASEGVLLVEHDMPALFLRSTNPKALVLRCKGSSAETPKPTSDLCPMGTPSSPSYDFMLDAISEGEAIIELRTSATSTDASTLYDSIRVETRTADRVAVELGDDGEAARVSRYDVARGDTFSVSRRAYAGGVELQTSSGISLCSSNPNIVTLVDGGIIFPEQSHACSDLMFLGARALLSGSTSISASLGSLSDAVPVHVSK